MSGTQRFQVTFEVRSRYLYARVEAATTDRQSAAEYLLQIIRHAEGLKLDRVLIDRQIAAGAGTTLVYLQTALLEEQARGMVVAIADSDPMNYIHLERGIRLCSPKALRIKAFEDMNAAENWLLES
jgi:hypothetical protein